MSEVLEVIDVMRQEVLHGMSMPQKSLPSKYFYDERGSELFDEITRLKEYYPTRTERTILKENVHKIGEVLGDEVELIEPGSGSSEKTRILLDDLDSVCCYVPIDISGDYLYKVADGLREEYPKIDIQPLSVDYTRYFEFPDRHPTARRIVFFPGSTIGNFKVNTVRRFFTVIANLVGKKGGLLIGVDLKKDIQVLEAAYNDSEEVTAAFNKNMLLHINNNLNSDFQPDLFDHKAVWLEDKGRIEMRLYVNTSHTVTIDEYTFYLKRGEYIHTENSHKYSLEEFEQMVSPWFTVTKVWTDENNYFSVQFLEPRK